MAYSGKETFTFQPKQAIYIILFLMEGQSHKRFLVGETGPLCGFLRSRRLTWNNLMKSIC